MKPAILITLLALSLFGCVSQRTKLDSWKGHTKYSLIQSWGPPVRTTDDGNKGEILIYARHVYAPQMNINYWEYKMMYADSDGIIYHWRVTHEPVAPTEIDIRFLN